MQEGRTPRFPPRIRRFGRAPSLGKMSAYSANFNSSGSQTFCKLEGGSTPAQDERSKSEPRIETMMELMHPRRLEKKANIRSNRRWSGMWPNLSQAAAIVRSQAERPSRASGTEETRA